MSRFQFLNRRFIFLTALVLAGILPAFPCQALEEGKIEMTTMHTKTSIEKLAPAALWGHFFEISRIPRCSGDEAGVRKYVQTVAEASGLAYEIDKVGNILVKRPATAGMESQPVLVLQSHLDMVCEKNKDRAHDFGQDPIALKQEGDWLKADGTTLGADNGIGVAAQLAVMTATDIQHGPLEMLFTIDEETGLVGASGLAGDWLQGRRMLNLDSEEDGVIYIGCAGGMDTALTMQIEAEAVPAGYEAFRLRVGGLQGGHSGLNIHEGRGNAIKLLARFLWNQAEGLQIRLADLDGGSKKNAIPRECDAHICLPAGNLEALRKAAGEFEAIVKNEYKVSDAGVFVQLEASEGPVPESVFTAPFQQRLLDLLISLPNGVMAMDQAIAGLVETSTNLGVVKVEGRHLKISTNQRSSIASRLPEISHQVVAAARLAGAEVDTGSQYPGWAPDMQSALLKQAEAAYLARFHKSPEIKAIHAGLECGIIGGKFPGMDMISFGPTLVGAHSPDERVDIPAVKRFWDFLVGILGS